MHLTTRTRPCQRRVPHRVASFQPEALEPRQLLSTADLASLVASPGVSAAISPDATRTPTPTGPFGPYQIRQAYGFNGIPALTIPATQSTPQQTVATDGTGETIAIVDAYNDPTIYSDVNAFDSAYSPSSSTVSGTNSLAYLYGQASSTPPSFLTVVGQSAASPLPANNSSWGLEESMDVEWAHAIAPGAKIVLVEANSAGYSDLTTAVQYASTMANVVSMSWGGSEFSGENSYDASTFGTSGVVYVAASGDSGVLEWPSSSPNVVAVGGTTLTANVTSGAYSSETAWSDSGGGVSKYEPLPTYQSNAFGKYASGRTTPDVAYDANPSTGIDTIYNGTLYEVGGTSVGTPQWAALFALADQARAVINNYYLPAGFTNWGPLDYSAVPKALYDLAYTEYQSTPSTVYHDITSGSNGRYSAGKGYDLVTGFGSPQANNLVQYLTTWSLPTGSPSIPFTSASPNVQGSAVGATSGVVPIASSAIVVATPALPPAGTQALVVGLPAGGSLPSAVAGAPALPAGPAPAAAVPPVTAARPAQPLPQAATTLIGTPLAAPNTLVPEELLAPGLHPLAPPAIEALPLLPGPGVENPAVPLASGRCWDDAVSAFLAGAGAPLLPLDPGPRESGAARDQTTTPLESSLAAAAAVALWAAWETRTRRADRRRPPLHRIP